MNFEEALRKVKAGTATDEERAFVEERIAEAQSALTPTPDKAPDFDEALAHVQDGTATDEEREYVRQQLADAKTILNGSSPKESALENLPSEDEDVEEEVSSQNEESAALEFEDALEHVQQGTATEQEKLYVKSQMAAANAFFSNDFRRSGAPIREASGAEVKKAKKSFKMRYVIIPLSVVLIVILAVGAILGGVFGFAASSAHKNMTISPMECEQRAKTYVLNNQTAWLPGITLTINDIHVDDVERHFNYNEHNLGASYYSYEVEVKGYKRLTGLPKPIELEVKLIINTMTGSIEVVKYKIDDD